MGRTIRLRYKTFDDLNMLLSDQLSVLCLVVGNVLNCVVRLSRCDREGTMVRINVLDSYRYESTICTERYRAKQRTQWRTQGRKQKQTRRSPYLSGKG